MSYYEGLGLILGALGIVYAIWANARLDAIESRKRGDLP